MSFMGAGAGAPGLRFATTRGRIQGGAQTGLNYPNPFFDLAHTYLPTTIKALFQSCRYYFLTQPLINATTFKLSEYPVTDIIFDHENEGTRATWEDYVQNHLRYRAFQVEVGLDYHCYGNALIGISFPFNKHLTCQKCGYSEQARRIRDKWVFTSYHFRLTCPKCGEVGEAKAHDAYIKDASGIKLVRWNPEDVEITYNDLTHQYTYYYNIPGPLRNDVTMGKKDVVEQTPQLFIRALKEQRGVIFSKEMLFHMRRPSISHRDKGWGTPLLLPVLKDAFYIQIMKKAQEAILLEHIVPLRIMFPQAGSGSSDPYCLSGTSIVEANLDYKTADQVCVGDLIKTAFGKIAPVTAVKRRAVKLNERVYRIVVCGMTTAPVEPSEEHPFLAVQTGGKRRGRVKNWTPSWVQAQDLQVGDYVAYPTSRQVHDNMQIDMAKYLPSYTVTGQWVYRQITAEGAAAYEFVEQREQRPFAPGELKKTTERMGWSCGLLQTTASRYRRGHRTRRTPRFLTWSKELATIIGYYLAEGCVDSGGGKVVFALHRNEQWICDELDDAFYALCGKKGRRDPKPPNGLSYVVNDSVFSEFLKNYCGHLAWNKKFPAEVVYLPTPILTQLVRCVVNGDGGAEQSTRDNGTGRPCRTSSVTYTTTSQPLALKLRELLLYLGVIGRVHTTPIGRRRKHTIYRVKVNGQMAVDLWAKLGWEIDADVHIKNDSTRCFFKDGYAYFRVMKKEEIQGVPFVYGFQVDGDRSFCVPACATHNTTINLDQWREHVSQEIARWRYDNNYIPLMPLPIGQETVGGDGKALLLTQEVQMWSEQLLNGMMVPREFIMGGLSYSGSNVSMRMMENMFLGYILYHKQLLDFVIRHIASYLDWPVPRARFKPFKMADDLQRISLVMQANAANKVSDTSFLNQLDMSQVEENKIMLQELSTRLEATEKQQLAMADIQGKSQMIMMKYQMKAQMAGQTEGQQPPAPGEPGGPDSLVAGTPGGQEQAAAGEGAPAQMQQQSGQGQAGSVPQGAQSFLSNNQNMGANGGQVDMQSWAMMQAQQLAQLPPEQQQVALQNLQQQSPELAEMVRQLLAQMGGGKPQAGTDMRPLPEKLPPRRAAQIV